MILTQHTHSLTSHSYVKLFHFNACVHKYIRNELNVRKTTCYVDVRTLYVPTTSIPWMWIWERMIGSNTRPMKRSWIKYIIRWWSATCRFTMNVDELEQQSDKSSKLNDHTGLALQVIHVLISLIKKEEHSSIPSSLRLTTDNDKSTQTSKLLPILYKVWRH